MDQTIRILGVDDDTLVQKQLGNFGKKMPNTEITVAADGPSAINQVKTNKYDMIFMDVFMPGMNGYEAVAEIRKLENGKDAPIIALSGDDLSEEELKKYTFNNFVKKPISKKVFEGFVLSIKK